MIIDIVRHAETFSNAEGRLQGNSDLLLSKNGVEQAQSLQKLLTNKYDIIFCSSMKRAQQTLALARGKSIEESTDNMELFGQVMLSDHLREMDLGILEGKIISEMGMGDMKIWRKLQQDHNYKEHGGESPRQFFNRVNSFFEELKELDTTSCFNNILVVTHNGVIKLLFKYIMGIDPPTISNADIIRVEIREGKLNFVGKVNNSFIIYNRMLEFYVDDSHRAVIKI